MELSSFTFLRAQSMGSDIVKKPFPLNPTFKPSAPVSDQLKTIIYEKFMANPTQNSVRLLAELHGLSMKRVDAILRLKGLEQHWKKVCQRRTFVWRYPSCTL